MKKVIILLFFAALTLAGTSQGFFRPVDKNMFVNSKTGLRTLEITQKWEFRPAITITAIQLNWNKLTKQFDASAFNQAGLGAGFTHFVELPDGTPFANYGINAILLLGVQEAEPGISFAVTGSFLQYVNIGGLYNFSNKAFGILTGVNLKF
jgi:hypothetical protein